MTVLLGNAAWLPNTSLTASAGSVSSDDSGGRLYALQVSFVGGEKPATEDAERWFMGLQGLCAVQCTARHPASFCVSRGSIRWERAGAART